MAPFVAIGAAFAAGWAVKEVARGNADRASIAVVGAVFLVLMFVHYEVEAFRERGCGGGDG